MSNQLPEIYGPLLVALLKGKFTYAAKDGRPESHGYDVQVPYWDGARIPQRIYLPRDGSVKLQTELVSGTYYAFPVTIRVGNGGKGLSFTMAAPAVEAPQ